MSRRRRLAILAAAVGLASGSAEAHLMNTGFGPFYDGLAHPLVTPEDLLPVVAISLLAGLRGARAGRAVVFLLPAAWLSGMVLGRAVAPPGAATWLTPALTIALGALVAADRDLPLPAMAGAAVVLGVVHGWLNGAGLAPAGAGLTAVLGVTCTIFTAATLLAGGVFSLKPPWTRIVVRVVGSWLAAIGLLMLGWAARTS
jgi:urease accessory protein